MTHETQAIKYIFDPKKHNASKASSASTKKYNIEIMKPSLWWSTESSEPQSLDPTQLLT